jgi:hypothetical protein
MPDTFIKNNLSIVITFLVAVFTAGGVFAEFTALKNEIHTVHERLDKKIKVINSLEDRILNIELQREYEKGARIHTLEGS